METSNRAKAINGARVQEAVLKVGFNLSEISLKSTGKGIMSSVPGRSNLM
jgi:hypothetical protein